MPVIQKWTQEVYSALPIQVVSALCVEETRRSFCKNPSKVHDFIVDTGANVLKQYEEYKAFELYELRLIIRAQLLSYNSKDKEFALTNDEGRLLIKGEFDSIHYWCDRVYHTSCSALAKVAIVFMKVVTTEAAVERSFSHLRFVHCDERNRLSDSNLKYEMILRMNDTQPRTQTCHSLSWLQNEELTSDTDENDL
jgi:hypothetical protein